VASGSLPIIILNGSPTERGRKHGAVLSRLIHARFRKLRQSAEPLAWRGAKSLAAKSFEQIVRLAPDVALELEGIADGAELAVLDIYLLSCFEYFAEGRTGCTSAGLSTPHGAILGQNWDAPAGEAGDIVVLLHEGANERFMTVASAGTLGWVGINGNGLAFVNNDLILDTRLDGLPSLVIRRMMLGAPNVAKAVGLLRQNPHMSGRCFLVGDAAGILRVAEVSPCVGVVDEAAHSMIHTNHPRFPAVAMWENGEAVARLYPSSHERLRAASSLPLTSIDDIKVILRDRSGAPDAVCKSVSAREATETAFSVILDCGRREVLIAAGRPDLYSYQHLKLVQGAEA
jgi:isopenicillin-N N-acyltransferase-like protein